MYACTFFITSLKNYETQVTTIDNLVQYILLQADEQV